MFLRAMKRAETDEASVVSQKERGKTVLAELAWNTLLLIKPSVLARELLAVAPTNSLFVSQRPVNLSPPL